MPDTIAPLEYVNCDLCGSVEQKLLYRKKSRYRKMQFSICRCNNCGLTFTNPRIPATLAHEVYSEEYYKGEGLDAHFKGETAQKSADAESLIKCIEHALGKTHFSILDAGGGAGLVTAAALKRGHDAHMSDLSAAAIEAARARGVSALLGTPDQLASKYPDKFDAVISLEVIEHVYSPKIFLSGIHKMLKPGGLFVFTTGNVGETRFKGENWGYFNIPEGHLYFFSTATMGRYLAEAGFDRRLDTYNYFFKRWWAVRLLSSVGIVRLPDDVVVKGPLQTVGMKMAKVFETALGRQRFEWAFKSMI